MTTIHPEINIEPSFLLRSGAEGPADASSQRLEITLEPHHALRTCAIAQILIDLLSQSGLLTLGLANLVEPYLKPSAFVSVQAITQRISRESNEKCAIIEKIAKDVVGLLGSGDVAVLRIVGAQYLDQASIRLLRRISFRAKRAGICLEFSADADLFAMPADDDLAAKIVHAGWIAAFAQSGQSGGDLGLAPISRVGYRLDENTSVSEAISLQSYDVAVAALHSDVVKDRPKSEAERDRILATILVNCGFLDIALAALIRAGAAAAVHDQVLDHSRIAYTHGLVLAKRLGDLVEAECRFREGLQMLAESELNQTADGRLAQAWHENGLALLAALDAKAARDAAMKQRLFTRAALHLKRAKEIIAGDEDKAADYLKQNLTANSVMLLEMDKKYDAARRLFTNRFESIARAQHAAGPSMVYHFRLAGLKARAGDLDGALVDLDVSRQNAVACVAEQAVGRIDLARADVLSSLGRTDEACTALESAIDDAWEREAFAALAASARVAESLWQASVSDRAGALRDRANSALFEAPPVQRVMAPFPAKLPSYVPFIDLLCDTDSTNDRLTAPAN